MRARGALVLALVAALAACTSEPQAQVSVTVPPGAESPEVAVTGLQSLLAQGDFTQASHLTVPDQAALAALAEGATFSEVANALEIDDVSVAGNFWSGFAQGAGEFFESGLVVESLGTTMQSNTEFHLVEVVGSDASRRRMVTQDIDGHRVDLFASFGSILAGRLISPVEVLLGSATDDALLILHALTETVPSLLVAAGEEGIPATSAQEIVQLVELITRVG